TRTGPALVDHPAVAHGLAETRRACDGPAAAVFTTTFDVTVPGEVTDAVARCTNALGSPTGLFNNAGVQGPFERVDRYPLDQARHVVDVNVVGALNVLTIAAAAMVSAGLGGSVVCSASMAGVTGAPNMVAYSA